MAERTNDELMQDIASRAAAMVQEQRAGESGLTEAQVEQFRAMFPDLLATAAKDPAVRKIVFGEGEGKLVGSKFARWGLTAGDIEMAYDLLTANQRGGGAGPSEELRQAFAAVSDAYYLGADEVRKIDQSAIDNLYPRVPKTRAQRLERDYAQRAMDTAESGYGQQLVGAQYVGDLWEAARPESRVFALLDTFEMTAPTAYLPVEVDIPEMFLVSESVNNNSSEYGTVKTGSNRVAVAAKKMLIHQMWSGEMEEDSIIPFLPFLRRQAALGIAHYSDSLVLNGDTVTAATGNINSDDAAPAATKHYLAFDGIRKAAIIDNAANASNAAGAVTLNGLRDLRGLMLDPTRIVDWGHPSNSDDLVYLCDPETADRIAVLSEVVLAKQYGGGLNANLLNGEVARILGHAVVSSMAVSKTAADYKADSATPANNVKGQVVAFNRRGFKVGWRRRVQVETERLPARDQTRIVYSMRIGLGRFSPTGAASGIEAAAVLGNITL